MDVAQYEIFLSFLRSLRLPLTDWAYPVFVKTSESRKVYRAKREFMRLATKNLEITKLAVNCKVLMYLVEVKLDGVLEVQVKKIPTQQMVHQKLAPLHVGFSASAKHTSRVRTQFDCSKAAEFCFSRFLGGFQAAVER